MNKQIKIILYQKQKYFFTNMSLSYKKQPLTLSFLKQHLLQRHLLDSSLKNAQIFNYMKRFVEFDIGKRLYEMVDIQQRIKIIKGIFRIIEKQAKENNKVLWLKGFAIHALFRYTILNDKNKQWMIIILSEQIQSIVGQLSGKNVNNLVNKGFVSRSLQKFSRSLSVKTFGSMFGTQDKNIKSKGLQNLQRSILFQYSLYLQKLIHDWTQIQQHLNLSSQQNQINITIQQKSNMIWKLCNIFKKLSKINKDYLKINQLLKNYCIYFYSMMNFISEDIQMLYDPIINHIRLKIKLLDWQNAKKISQFKGKLSKPFINMLQKVNQIKSMIQELGQVNQVVLFVFLGCFHYKHLYKKIRPTNFISINDPQFDKVFTIAKQMEYQKQKALKFQYKCSPSLQKDLKKMTTNTNVFIQTNKEPCSMKAAKYKSAKLKQMENDILKTPTKYTHYQQRKQLQLTQTSVKIINQSNI